MAVTKSLRYQILRRDNHACRYCGATAPDTKLAVDHVVPQALGGSDDPSNLVTACQPCNSGKSATPADASVVADVAADALRWKRAIQAVLDMEEDALAQQERFEADLWRHTSNAWANTFDIEWGYRLPYECVASLMQMLAAGATEDDFDVAMTAAAKRRPADTWRYFCGAVYNIIRRRHEKARELINQGLI